MNELEAIKAIDDVLTALAEQEARKRALRWAWDKFVPNSAAPELIADDKKVQRAEKRRKGSGKKKSGSQSASQPISLVKDLNLKPKGKQSLDEFVDLKKPSSLYEKCTVAIFYLRNELAISVSASHVYTCFKHMKWKLPTDLGNTLSYTASQHGWIDSRNMLDLRVTAIGENLVEHDLPKVSKKKT